ncbi:MAG: 1-deoxy-D-xylulose-5-phosphate reductoisomerase [Nitrospirae bacterium]|nr:1-deoxy-D-xylulose-5-phosphate reductoisomerase [Nitrospirota bacterium]
MIKNISVLGSTGSIGRSTMDIVRQYPDRFRIVGLAAYKNIDMLEEQIREFRPDIVGVYDAQSAETLSRRVGGVRVAGGLEGIIDVAIHPEAEFVVSAISGSAGLIPTLEAIRAGKTIGLANKETLVMAGPLVQDALVRYNARLIPVDSEHSAIFQCLEGRDKETVRRLILTASGGPFHGYDIDNFSSISAEDALNHPTWRMGKKITIDSATLMNKGLEVIEAHFLFGFSHEDIDVLIHPQCIIHSMIEFKDGSLLAQLSVPDMKGPIAYAMAYPERLEGVLSPCRLPEIGALTFDTPDTENFPCLGYAYEALKVGGTMPAVLNAANEMAVEAFLSDTITFRDIPVIIKKVMDAHNPEPIREIKEVLRADAWARAKFNEILEDM